MSPYRSELRQRQAAGTRDRILAAFADQLGRPGTTDVNVVEAATTAGVSVRTVYHHFPDRTARLEGLATWLTDQMGPIEARLDTVDDLPNYVRAAYARAEKRELLTRAGLVAGMSLEVRNRRMVSTRTRIHDLLKPIGATPAQTRRAAAVIAVLESSEAGFPLVDFHGLSFREAAEAAASAVAAIISDLRGHARRG